MSFVAAAIVAGGAIAGSAMSANAANKASKGQSAATAGAMAESSRQFDLSRMDSAAYRGLGNQAANKIGDLLGLSRGATRNSGDLVVSVNGVPMLNPRYEDDPEAQRAWREVLMAHNSQL